MQLARRDPYLLQRRFDTCNRRVCAGTIRSMLAAASALTGLTDPGTYGPLYIMPHGFLRTFITGAVMPCLPPHITQIIDGDRDINANMG